MRLPDWPVRRDRIERFLRIRHSTWAEGPSRLARVLNGVAFGDLVSVYLAILYQTDPTPVTLLSMLKQRLARSTD